jgi:hypothetical protein
VYQAGVFQNGTLNHAGRVGIVVTEANERSKYAILRGHGAQFPERRAFPERRRQRHRPPADSRRHRHVDQGVDRSLTQQVEHRAGCSLIIAEMAAGE